MGGPLQDQVEGAAGLGRCLELAALEQCVEVEGEEFTEYLGRHTQPHGQDPGRVVMAGDQAPELTADDDRDRHGSCDAHVAQVLAVDRRDTAEMGERQVNGRIALAEFGNKRHWDKRDVPDYTYPVFDVEMACLYRNVRDRKMLSEEAA